MDVMTFTLSLAFRSGFPHRAENSFDQRHQGPKSYLRLLFVELKCLEWTKLPMQVIGAEGAKLDRDSLILLTPDSDVRQRLKVWTPRRRCE